MITFLIFLDTFPPVLALELRQLESCSLYLLLYHNYPAGSSLLSYLTGHHGLVTTILIALVPAVKVSVTDVLPGYPQAAHGVLLMVGRRPTLVVCLVLLSVI